MSTSAYTPDPAPTTTPNCPRRAVVAALIGAGVISVGLGAAAVAVAAQPAPIPTVRLGEGMIDDCIAHSNFDGFPWPPSVTIVDPSFQCDGVISRENEAARTGDRDLAITAAAERVALVNRRYTADRQQTTLDLGDPTARNAAVITLSALSGALAVGTAAGAVAVRRRGRAS